MLNPLFLIELIMLSNTKGQTPTPQNSIARKNIFSVFQKSDGGLYAVLIVFAIGVLAGFLLQLFLSRQNTPKKTVSLYEKRLYGSYKYINPLLECVSDLGAYQPINKLKDKVSAYIDAQKKSKNATEVAVYYRDLNNGPWFGIDEQSYFSPASLVKVPLMIAYLELTEHVPDLLGRKIKNELVDADKMYSGINYPVEDKLVIGKEYTVEDLIDRMIINSDNVAYNLLFDYLDSTELQTIYNDFGIDVSRGRDNPDGDTMTLKDYSSFFRILYNSSYLDKDLSEKALKILTESKFKDGLVAGIPGNLEVAHKFGERTFTGTRIEKQLHDCGIIYATQKIYLLCIMTRGSDFKALSGIIKDISAEVYSYVAQDKTYQ